MAIVATNNFGPSCSELAEKPIAPQDAAMMEAAEARIFGRTQKGGPAAAIQAAAAVNERAEVVGHGDVTGDKGVTVTATDYPGIRIVTEWLLDRTRWYDRFAFEDLRSSVYKRCNIRIKCRHYWIRRSKIEVQKTVEKTIFI